MPIEAIIAERQTADIYLFSPWLPVMEFRQAHLLIQPMTAPPHAADFRLLAFTPC
jgi:hypothetical protein